MSFTVNNSVNNSSGATSQAVSISVVAGHTVAGFAFFNDFGNGGSISSVTDSGGNTYTLGIPFTVTGTNITCRTFRSIAIASAITSVTMNTTGTTGSGGFCDIFAWDLTSTGTIAFSIDGGANPNPASLATDGVTTGTLSITTADGLLLGFSTDFSSGTMVAGTGFTTDAGTVGSSRVVEHKAISSSAAVTFTATSADNVLVMGLALQASSAAATTTGGLLARPGPGLSPDARLQFQPVKLSSQTNGSQKLTGQSMTWGAGNVSSAVTRTATFSAILQAGPGVGPDVRKQFTPLQLSTQPSALTSTPITGLTFSWSAGSVSSGEAVNQSLTGQSLTWSAGSITSSEAINQSLNGQSFTWTPGTVTTEGDETTLLTGQSFTWSAGSVTTEGDETSFLTGQSFTWSAGNVSGGQAVTQSLLGQSMTWSPGSLTTSQADSTSLTGQSFTWSAGNLSSGGSPNIGLTGQSLTWSAGSLSSSEAVSQLLTGQSFTWSAGSVSSSETVSQSLTGSTFTWSAGSITAPPTINQALTGQTFTWSAGNLTMANVTLPLVGNLFAWQAGRITPSGGTPVFTTSGVSGPYVTALGQGTGVSGPAVGSATVSSNTRGVI